MIRQGITREHTMQQLCITSYGKLCFIFLMTCFLSILALIATSSPKLHTLAFLVFILFAIFSLCSIVSHICSLWKQFFFCSVTIICLTQCQKQNKLLFIKASKVINTMTTINVNIVSLKYVSFHCSLHGMNVFNTAFLTEAAKVHSLRSLHRCETKNARV